MSDLQSNLILFLILLVSIILLRVIFKSRKSALPPSPLALPIIGHLHLLSQIPHQALYKLSNRYGPLIHLYLGSVPCVVVTSAEIAKEVLKTHENTFSDRPQLDVMNFLIYGSQSFAFGRNGPYWKFMRKLCITRLLGGLTLDLLSPIRREELKRFIEIIWRKSKSGEAVNVRVELIKLTNNAISRMIMSKRCSEKEDEADEINKIVHEIVESLGKFNMSDFIWFCKNLDLQGYKRQLKGTRERFTKIMETSIEEHLEARKKRKETADGSDVVKDLLDIILEIADEESSDMKLTKVNIRSFFMDLFVAGTDTSAITTEWALAELINHPNVLKKAREEINFIVGENRLVEESDIPNLPYLQAIVKETLRLHPTVPLISRESIEDCIISNYKIPARTSLFVNTWAICRDPKYWENPLEFQPERFVNEEGSGKIQLDVRGQHFHYLPFGSGRRVCPGISLGLHTVQTGLATMIQCFEWKVGSGTIDMEEGHGLTVPMAHPLVCVPVPRLISSFYQTTLLKNE